MTWRGACTGQQSCSLPLDAPAAVEAVFEHAYRLVRNHTGDGTLTATGSWCGTRCDDSFAEGETVSVVATPSSGWSFDGWDGACSGPGACTFTMTGPTQVNATFSPSPPAARYMLTAGRAGSGSGVVASTPSGITCGTDCVELYEAGTAVTLTATPVQGSMFTGWTGACVGLGTCTLTLAADTTAIATFELVATAACTVTVSQSESATQFNARLTTPGTVCLADGVTITGAVQFGANNITVQSAPGATVHLVNFSGDTIDLAGKSGIRLVGLDITSDGAQLTSAIVVGSGAQLELDRSTVHCEAGNCYLLKVTSGRATITNSTLRGGSATASYRYSYGVYGYSSAVVQISTSTITSEGTALNVTVGSSFTVTGSTLRGLNTYAGGGNATITVYNGASLDLRTSTVLTTGFDAISGGGAASGVSIRLDGNMIRKAAGQPAMQVSPIRSDRADDVFHSSSPNTFCNEGTATDDAAFAAPLIAGSFATTSTFASAAQIGPSNCP